MKQFETMSEWLLARQQEHQKRIERISTLIDSLTDRDPEFEVQFRAIWPDQTATTARRGKLGDAYNEAVRLWRTNNVRSLHVGLPLALSFLCIEELLIPINPEDALLILVSEGKTIEPSLSGASVILFQSAETTMWQLKETPLLMAK